MKIKMLKNISISIISVMIVSWFVFAVTFPSTPAWETAWGGFMSYFNSIKVSCGNWEYLRWYNADFTKNCSPVPVCPAGPQGPQGPTGSVWAMGPQGPAWPASTVAWPQGPTGAQGPAWPASTVAWPQGPAGLAWPQGPTGPAGAIGPVWPQGPMGPQGLRGPTGTIAWPQGATWVKGATGPQGPMGPQGPAWATVTCSYIYTPPSWFSTPYLFTNIGGADIIENDVMATYFDDSYEKAKSLYETEGWDKLKYSIYDYYRMRINPIVYKEWIKLAIKEIENEESRIDQIKLQRYLLPKDAELITDTNSSTPVKAVRKTLVKNKMSCVFKDKDCLDEMMGDDDKIVIGKPWDDEMILKFDISKLRDKQVFLTIDSWQNSPLKPQSSPFEADAKSLELSFMDDSYAFSRLKKDIHPNEIQSDSNIEITDIISQVKSDMLILKIKWTNKHHIWAVNLSVTEEVPFRTEEISLISAESTNGWDVRKALVRRDHEYAHTVKWDSIDLLFGKPKMIRSEEEKENYVFVSAGFYYWLRTYVYPWISIDEGWKNDLFSYVEELKWVLRSQGSSDKARTEFDNHAWVRSCWFNITLQDVILCNESLHGK